MNVYQFPLLIVLSCQLYPVSQYNSYIVPMLNQQLNNNYMIKFRRHLYCA